MLPIAITIVLATWAGLSAEHRLPGRAGTGSRQALTFALYAILPPVVFFNLVKADLDSDFAVAIGLAWIVLAVCAGVAYLIGKRVLGLRDDQVGALICCVVIANTAYLGLPLVAAMQGVDRVGEAVAYDIGVGGIGLLVGGFSIGAALGTKAGEGAAQRTKAFFARNIPLYAGIAGLLAPDALAPDLLVDLSRIAIVLLLPLGFFAVGAALAEDADRGQLRLPPRLTPAVGTVIGIKLLLMPALLVAIAAPLIDLPATFLLMAAMPSGLNSMIVVHTYGLDLRITAGALVWTTALVVPVALVVAIIEGSAI